ncbi:MAG TPA: regulatory iron-sulfur-containing complex subunit RicT [Meiothermus sp.]|jgi:cell fate regulator YaaT (PSP1 superfamily)|nr:regulatory iron-sulfur-containing complex subunit RicT [Meiothermus sp.]
MNCLGVRFNHSPKLYDYSFEGEPPPPESWVVVQTSRGLELGKVRTAPRQGQPQGRIVRPAEPEDLDKAARLREKAEEVKWWIKARLRKEKVQAKVLGCDYTLDGSHLAVHYSAEERIDLRRWVGEIARTSGARVEFVAMGPRDQTAYLGTLGACGMESCCSTHLQDFAQVSIKMARDQQLPLSPEKISGPCGRLLCCLQYEHEHYQELLRDLPRKNAKVCTIHDVCGKVAKLNPLAGTVDLITEEGSWVTAHKSELRQ